MTGSAARRRRPDRQQARPQHTWAGHQQAARQHTRADHQQTGRQNNRGRLAPAGRYSRRRGPHHRRPAGTPNSSQARTVALVDNIARRPRGNDGAADDAGGKTWPPSPSSPSPAVDKTELCLTDSIVRLRVVFRWYSQCQLIPSLSKARSVLRQLLRWAKPLTPLVRSFVVPPRQK
jgi:hypothetical protein